MKPLPSNKIKDIRGERFGRLIVTEFSHISRDKGKNAHWTCICDCGNTTTVSSAPLRAGTSQSCGCLAREMSRQLIKKTHILGKHLYFIQCNTYVKIGRADNIRKRLTQLQSMNPYKLILLAEKIDEGYREHEYHELCKEFHHSGEWFLLDGVRNLIDEIF